MPKPTKRWIIYGTVLGLALVAVWSVRQPAGRLAASRVQVSADRLPRAIVAAPAANHVPELELERLAQRARVNATTDLLSARGWEALEGEAPPRNAPPPSPRLPQAPPLPFAFIGKLIDDGKTIVFLTKADRNYVVRLGDTIDGTYRVDEIGEQSMTLTYLPLESKQSLAVGSPALLLPSLAQSPTPTTAPVPAPAASNEPAKLVWIAPPQAKIGEKFTVEVGLPVGPQPRSGRVELVYDARVLAVLGGAAAAPAKPTDSANARRAIVEVIGPGFPGAPPTPSEVRFRVLAANPTNTQIVIENLSAVASSRPLVVATPGAYQLAIVQDGASEAGAETR